MCFDCLRAFGVRKALFFAKSMGEPNFLSDSFKSNIDNLRKDKVCYFTNTVQGHKITSRGVSPNQRIRSLLQMTNKINEIAIRQMRDYGSLDPDTCFRWEN